jgi:predicted DNA-binding transcriptional regulator YafY
VRFKRGRPSGEFIQHRRMQDLRTMLNQNPKGMTLEEIANRLHVTQRSARRYVSRIEADLEWVTDQPGGRKRWRIPSLDLPRRIQIRRTQAYALLATRALFDPMRGSTLYEEIDLANQALLGVARRPGRGPNAGIDGSRLEQRFRYLPFAPKQYRGELVDVVFQCVGELRPLRCRLRDGTRRVLHPYALLIYKEAMYCLMGAADSDQVETVGLDTIADARVVEDNRFELPGNFDVDDYLQGQFGLWSSESPTEQVVIELEASVADYALSRCVHPTQHVERLDSGRVRLTFDIARTAEVTSWVIGFGSLATVIAPQSLRDAVAAELERALERYR